MEWLETQLSKREDFPMDIRQKGLPVMETPSTTPRSDAPADCVRATARDADAFLDGRENRSPPAHANT